MNTDYAARLVEQALRHPYKTPNLNDTHSHEEWVRAASRLELIVQWMTSHTERVLEALAEDEADPLDHHGHEINHRTLTGLTMGGCPHPIFVAMSVVEVGDLVGVAEGLFGHPCRQISVRHQESPVVVMGCALPGAYE